MSFTAFTAVTGYPLQGIDLYLMSSTGAVLNTRSNLEVRHNETNRFFVVPHSPSLSFKSLYTDSGFSSNFMSLATISALFNTYGRHFMISATIAARTLENSGDYAFYASTTSAIIDQYDFHNFPENSINYPAHTAKNIGTFSTNVAQFVVTSMSSQVLELSRSSLVAGGDGSVPLVAQVMYVAGVQFGSSFMYNNFQGRVSTIFSQPFDIKYVAPLHRTLAY
jgi:hypothetical protein